MMEGATSSEEIARKLAALYDQPFGGKAKGRYRVPMKLIRQLAGRRRLYEDDIRNIARALLEQGYVLVDMDGFFVVLSANTFVNYRRANEDCMSSR